MRTHGNTPLLREEETASMSNLSKGIDHDGKTAKDFSEAFLQMIETKREGVNTKEHVQYFNVVCPCGPLGFVLEEHEFSRESIQGARNESAGVPNLGLMTIGRMQMKSLKGVMEGSGIRKKQRQRTVLKGTTGDSNGIVPNRLWGTSRRSGRGQAGKPIKPGRIAAIKCVRLYPLTVLFCFWMPQEEMVKCF
jgi:hypothetical protein